MLLKRMMDGTHWETHCFCHFVILSSVMDSTVHSQYYLLWAQSLWPFSLYLPLSLTSTCTCLSLISLSLSHLYLYVNHVRPMTTSLNCVWFRSSSLCSCEFLNAVSWLQLLEYFHTFGVGTDRLNLLPCHN